MRSRRKVITHFSNSRPFHPEEMKADMDRDPQVQSFDPCQETLRRSHQSEFAETKIGAPISRIRSSILSRLVPASVVIRIIISECLGCLLPAHFGQEFKCTRRGPDCAFQVGAIHVPAQDPGFHEGD